MLPGEGTRDPPLGDEGRQVIVPSGAAREPNIEQVSQARPVRCATLQNPCEQNRKRGGAVEERRKESYCPPRVLFCSSS